MRGMREALQVETAKRLSNVVDRARQVPHLRVTSHGAIEIPRPLNQELERRRGDGSTVGHAKERRERIVHGLEEMNEAPGKDVHQGEH